MACDWLCIWCKKSDVPGGRFRGFKGVAMGLGKFRDMCGVQSFQKDLIRIDNDVYRVPYCQVTTRLFLTGRFEISSHNEALPSHWTLPIHTFFFFFAIHNLSFLSLKYLGSMPCEASIPRPCRSLPA